MQKLAKSLGIKSVVSMHTGKGSLSYFLDDDREAKKLQKFLQRSFKRVRLISLDKSKGDTANWVVAADMLGFESVNERVKDPKLKKGQKIRFKNDSRRVYTLKKINVGVRGISDKDDPSGTSYMFVAPGNRKEYFTKKTWNDAVKKGWLQLESINERFRPSDRKVLMVVVRDIINKLRKRNPDIDRPDRQLGQALNAILRAMTREKSDRNYRQYKKYFPKYNDKLLRRLASAYFDESYNVQNTFMRNAMKYSFKESVNEKKGVPGSVFTIDTAKKTSELMTKALKKVAPDIRRGQIYHSALGGTDRVSIVGKFSLDPKKTWANNILENSRFITFHLDNDGTLEVNVNGYPFAMRRKVQMRKSRNNDIKQVLKRMITHFSMLNKKYPEGM